MRQSKKVEAEYTSIDLQDVNVKAFVPEDRIKGEHAGYMEVKYSPTRRFSDTLIARFHLTSVWLDPSRTDIIKTCKVHAMVPSNPVDQEERNAVKIHDMLMSMSGERRISRYSSPGMSLSADDFNKSVIYRAQDNPYKAKGEGYTYTPIFDNKAEAFMSIMEAIKQYSAASVAGIDLINLNNISDGLLEEIGFAKVPDQIGTGIPMWFGDAEAIASLGRRTYGYRDYSTTSNTTSKEVVESLLDLIEEDLSDKQAA